MKRNEIYVRILKAIRNFLLFFLLIAFLVTCTTMLFVTTLSASLGITLDGENLEKAAKLTFGNVVLLSLIISLIDAVRRRVTVDRSAKAIAEAAKRLSEGDFTARVENTNRLYTDDKFNEIIDCFNKLAGELSSVETLRSDFISNVSHEIKTPLSVISNYASLLSSREISDSERIEYAEAIMGASKRLSDMITNILKLSRLENQEIFPNKEKYNLSEQLCECLLSYEGIWEKKRLDMEIDIKEDVKITADKELLSHVWSNLISNAMKFADDGGRVSVTLTEDSESITVKVGDNGCGMSREVGMRIFEKFYQGDTSHATSGNGLGLALVKRIIDIVGGEIGVESSLGEGSTFTVRLEKNDKKGN